MGLLTCALATGEQIASKILMKQKSYLMLSGFFEPRGVVVVGASRNPGKGGYTVVENFVKTGFKDKVFPINPHASEILGVRAYKSVKDVPKGVADLALILVPAEAVPTALHECGECGIKNVIIESGGFAEVGNHELEREVVSTAKRYGIRVMGPNSIGVVNTRSGLFTPYVSLLQIRGGGVAFVGQTGLFASVFLEYFNERHIGISKIVCLGNKCDVDEADLLEYLGNDPETKVICMYIEGVRDGRRLMTLAKRISKQKPIIVLKAGRTELGRKAAASHTGTLAGDDKIYDAAFKQCGIIRVSYFEELFDVAKAFASQPLPNGKNVGIITVTGAGGVTAADYCMERGLELPSLSKRTLEGVKRVFPEWASLGNPLDVWVAVEASGMERTYEATTRALVEDENVDALIVVLAAVSWTATDVKIFKNLGEECMRRGKSFLFVSLLGEYQIFKRCVETLEPEIPVFPTVERAVRALAALVEYRDYVMASR